MSTISKFYGYLILASFLLGWSGLLFGADGKVGALIFMLIVPGCLLLSYIMLKISLAVFD